MKLTNKARYIQEILSEIVDLRKKNAGQVNDLLVSRKFDMIDGDYKYLIKMPMDSVTEENIANIIKDRDSAIEELNELMSTSLERMWLTELVHLEKEYNVYKLKREQIQSGIQSVKKTTVKIVKKIVKT